MGESYFLLASKDAGLVANSSTDDKAGWDFEVEAPSPVVVDYGHHSKPVFRVQIKATTGTSSKTSMTFSSLLSLIRYGGPAFVLLYQFTDEIAPAEAFVLHIDQALGAEILREMRRKQIADPAFKVNKVKTTIRFGPENKLASTNGSSLRSAFESALGGPYLQYLEGKAKWLKELEQDSGRRRVRLVLEDEAAMRAMADCFLGFDRQFRVRSATYFAPMGIPDKEPVLSEDFHAKTIKPVAEDLRRARVRMRTSEYGRAYEFDAVLYFVSPHLPQKFSAMRVHCALFDFVIRSADQSIEFMPVDLAQDSLRVPVDELRGFAAYMREAFESEETIVEITTEDNSPPLEMRLQTSSPQVSSNFDQIQAALEALHSKLASIGLTKALFRPADLFESLERYSFLIHADRTFDEALEFDFEVSHLERTQADAVIFQMPIALEGKTVSFFSAYFGRIDLISDKQARGRFSRSEYLGEIVVPDGHDLAAATRREGERLEKLLRRRGISVL